MFEIFVKHFLTGTKFEIMSLEQYKILLDKWELGEDIFVGSEVIPNKYIESIYSRKCV